MIRSAIARWLYEPLLLALKKEMIMIVERIEQVNEAIKLLNTQTDKAFIEITTQIQALRERIEAGTVEDVANELFDLERAVAEQQESIERLDDIVPDVATAETPAEVA